MNSIFANHCFLGWLLLIIGIAIRYIIGKRRFERRGIGGLQQFKSYPIALITLFIEMLFRLIANAFIACGAFLLIF